jgi:hypothetical protein
MIRLATLAVAVSLIACLVTDTACARTEVLTAKTTVSGFRPPQRAPRVGRRQPPEDQTGKPRLSQAGAVPTDLLTPTRLG